MRYAKNWPHLTLAAGCAVSGPLWAATGGRTNEAVLSYDTSAITLESTERSDGFIGRFFEEVTRSDSTVFDRFAGPSSQLAWARRQDTLGYASLNQFNADGASMFATIALDSLRIAATEVLPLDRWQEQWQAALANFFIGAIGNPQEEHVEITSISYSEVRLSWERVNEKAGIQWGFRPWRASPYLYFLAHAGRLDGWPLITFEGRAGYGLLSSITLQGRLTLQLPASFRIAGAAEVDPVRIGSHDPGATHIAVTLERVVSSRGRNPAAVFYAGFRSGVNGMSSIPRPENMFVAGLSKPW